MEELSTEVYNAEGNYYPDIIKISEKNFALRSPYAITDCYFYQTRETIQDIDIFRNFLKNAESRFRASREYKAYKYRNG